MTSKPTSARRLTITSLVALVLATAVAGCGTAALADAEQLGATTAGIASPMPSTVPTPTIARVPAATVPIPSAAPPLATPVPAPTTTPEPKRTKYAMDLYRPGDFVAQYTFEWCVGASLQMTINMATSQHESSRASQKALWKMAQARSSSPYGGSNPRGWTASLNDLGIGPYVLVSIPTFDEALQVAVEAMRATKRPVGLVMWRGRHAWVMSGFESIGDPKVHDDVTVTGIRVLDPLHPHGSLAWGASPRPNELLKPAKLARQFVVRDTNLSRTDLGVPTGYLLVLPTVAQG